MAKHPTFLDEMIRSFGEGMLKGAAKEPVGCILGLGCLVVILLLLVVTVVMSILT